MGLRGRSEEDPVLTGLYDLSALRLCHGPPLPHASDLWSAAASDTER